MLGLGVRPPGDREEELLEKAAYYDMFAARYRWDIETVDRQPQWFISRAPLVWKAQAEVANENRG